MLIQFTGKELLAFGRKLPATCVVRNELNGWRKNNQVVITMGQTVPHGLPYYPRQFPPGEWEITRVADCAKDGEDAEYWPVWMDTNATQLVRIWELDEEGNYYGPLYKWVPGHGYGIHHARYSKDGEMVDSNTTIGCINILDPENARWLGDEIREAVGMRQRMHINVPPWKEWQS